ncbi:MAG: S8 family peptidase [Ruminiclostridium sp.]|nr:S8 family peptidase [Ruminiclostridium sp.]
MTSSTPHIFVATPFISGVAALVKSKNLSMNPQEIRDALAHNAIDLGDTVKDGRYSLDWCRWLKIKAPAINATTHAIIATRLFAPVNSLLFIASSSLSRARSRV